MPLHEIQRGLHGNVGTMVPTHAINSNGNSHPKKDKRKGRHSPIRGICLPNPESLLARSLYHFLAAVVAGRADMMPQVDFTRCRLNGKRGICQKIVGTMHTTLGWGLFVLLNGHV